MDAMFPDTILCMMWAWSSSVRCCRDTRGRTSAISTVQPSCSQGSWAISSRVERFPGSRINIRAISLRRTMQINIYLRKWTRWLFMGHWITNTVNNVIHTILYYTVSFFVFTFLQERYTTASSLYSYEPRPMNEANLPKYVWKFHTLRSVWVNLLDTRGFSFFHLIYWAHLFWLKPSIYFCHSSGWREMCLILIKAKVLNHELTYFNWTLFLEPLLLWKWANL